MHGRGAKLKWRLLKTKSMGPNGILRPDREYYRVCDVGMTDRRLVQPKITHSWAKKTATTPTLMPRDTKRTYSSNINVSNTFTTPTVGQSGMGDAETGAGIN